MKASPYFPNITPVYMETYAQILPTTRNGRRKFCGGVQRKKITQNVCNAITKVAIATEVSPRVCIAPVRKFVSPLSPERAIRKATGRATRRNRNR